MYEKFDSSFAYGSLDVLDFREEVPQVVIEGVHDTEQSTNFEDSTGLDTSVVGVPEFRTDDGLESPQENGQAVVVDYVPDEAVGLQQTSAEETPTRDPVVETTDASDPVGIGEELSDDVVTPEQPVVVSNEGGNPDLSEGEGGLENELLESEPGHDDGLAEENEEPELLPGGGDVVDPPTDNPGTEAADGDDDNSDELPSMDPRDPRDETDPDPEAELRMAVLKAISEGGIEKNSEQIKELLTDGLRRYREKQQLELILEGRTAEEAEEVTRLTLDMTEQSKGMKGTPQQEIDSQRSDTTNGETPQQTEEDQE